MRDTMREAKLYNQSVGALVVGRRYHDGMVQPSKIFADMRDVLEYARFFYGTEDVVLVDSWGGVVETTEYYSTYDHNRPVAIAKAEHAETPEGAPRPYVNGKYQELRIYATDMATFAELDAPSCTAKRVKAGVYTAGAEDSPERFLISRDKLDSRKSLWTVEDRRKGGSFHYHATIESAKRKVNEILRREVTAAHIAKRCTSPHR